MSLAQPLVQGLAELGLEFAPAANDRFLAYLDLVQKWNRVYNLTAVREPARMLSQHLFDSLAIVPHLSGSSLLDVGSGAGLPGIPVAIARPRLTVTLLESNHKKAAFLKQAAIELRLDNVTVACERAEAWETARRFDLVVSRALADLSEFVRLAGRLVAPGGALAAMKGVYPYDELAQLPAGWSLKEAVALRVPGLRAARHWLRLELAQNLDTGARSGVPSIGDARGG
jgi:16S rRNA (guanine527-N7)-methyltransferase